MNENLKNKKSNNECELLSKILYCEKKGDEK